MEQQKVITCKECYSKVSADVGYCPVCGARLSFWSKRQRKVQDNSSSTQQGNSTYKPKVDKSDRNHSIRVALLWAFTLCLFAAGLIYEKKSSETAIPSQVEEIFTAEGEAVPDTFKEQWVVNVVDFIQQGQPDSALFVVKQQELIEERDEAFYLHTSKLFTENDYPAEGASILLQGAAALGSIELLQEAQRLGTPNDLITSDSLRGVLSRALGKPASAWTWTDVQRLAYLHVENDRISYRLRELDSARNSDSSTSHSPEVELLPLGQYVLQSRIDDDSWRAADLSLLSGLQELNWDSNASLTVEALAVLPQLTTLTLGSYNAEDLLPLPHLPQLKKLSLRGSSLISLEGAELLEKLQHLTLNRTGVSDLTPLNQAPQLTALTLVNNSELLGPDALTKLSKLEDLTIEGADWISMQPLQALTSLRSLALVKTSIKDISFLAALPQLRQLKLINNDKLIQAAPLEQLIQLETLVLDAYNLNKLDSLSKLTGLRKLELAGADDITPLAKLTGLEELTISRSKGARSLQGLQALTALRELHIHEITGGIESIIPILKLTGIQSLSITDTILYENMNELRNLQNLQELNLQNASIQLNPSVFSELSKLQALDLTKTKIIKDVSIDRQGALTRIYYNNIDWQDILGDLQAPKQLHTLSLASNELIDIDFFRSGWEGLRSLNLSDNSITDISPLLAIPQLEQVHLTDNPVHDWSALASLKALELIGRND